MWADPVEESKGSQIDFMENNERSCSVKYGLRPVKKILTENSLSILIRGHQVQASGYKMHYWGNTTALPAVITIFSAPNYCDCYKNKASIIKLEVYWLKITFTYRTQTSV